MIFRFFAITCMFLSVCYNHWTYYYWYPHAYVLSIHLQCVQRKHRSKLKRPPPPYFNEFAFCILTNSSNPAPGSFSIFSFKTVPFRQSNVMHVACAQLTNKMSNLQTKENRFLIFSSVLSVCLHGKVCKCMLHCVEELLNVDSFSENAAPLIVLIGRYLWHVYPSYQIQRAQWNDQFNVTHNPTCENQIWLYVQSATY